MTCVSLFLKAAAELLHERVRKDLWGYASEEHLEASDLHRIKYAVRLSTFLAFLHVCR